MGDENTTTVQTADASDSADAGSVETVLTSANVDTTGDDTGSANSDEGAAAAASADDSTTSDDQGGTDAGTEGSDTPPDTYADFAVPEGMELDEIALAEAAPIFKELGLTQEQAQKVVDLYAAQIQAGSQKQINDFNQLVSEWGEQSKNDSEFGGDKFDENVKIAQAAVDKYGTPELKQLMSEHGIGSHPEMVRFMVRVGRTLKEDVPGSSGNATSSAQSRVDILYPNQNSS